MGSGCTICVNAKSFCKALEISKPSVSIFISSPWTTVIYFQKWELLWNPFLKGPGFSLSIESTFGKFQLTEIYWYFFSRKPAKPIVVTIHKWREKYFQLSFHYVKYAIKVLSSSKCFHLKAYLLVILYPTPNQGHFQEFQDWLFDSVLQCIFFSSLQFFAASHVALGSISLLNSILSKTTTSPPLIA